MIILGLTGSIAMGKSTVGAMMGTLGIPVHDSDKSVHQLMAINGEARPAIAAAFPYYEYPEIYVRKTKAINRAEFGKMIFNDDDKRAFLESILHPLVRKKQIEFIRAHAMKKTEIICLDIPLLFETGADKRVDYTITASAPHFLQKQRVMARPHMSAEKFAGILARQMPDSQKCARSDYVIKTGLGRAHSMQTLREIIMDIRAKGQPEKQPVFDDIEIYS